MRLQIKRLYGEKDYDLMFNDDLTILIGHNGSGKSTILKILKYIFIGDLSSLSKILFEEIILTFPFNDVVVKKYENGIGRQIENLEIRIKYSEIVQLECVKDAKFRVIFKSFLEEYDFTKDIDNCEFNLSRFVRELLIKFENEKSGIPFNPNLEIDVMADMNEFFGWEGKQIDDLNSAIRLREHKYSNNEYNALLYLVYCHTNLLEPTYGSVIYFYGIYLSFIRINILKKIDFSNAVYKIPGNLKHNFMFARFDREEMQFLFYENFILQEEFDEKWLKDYYDCFLIKDKDNSRVLKYICYDELFKDEVKQKQIRMMFRQYYQYFDLINYVAKVQYDDYVTFNEEIKYNSTLLTKESFVKLVKTLSNPIRRDLEQDYVYPIFEIDYSNEEMDKVKNILNLIKCNKKRYELLAEDKTIENFDEIIKKLDKSISEGNEQHFLRSFIEGRRGKSPEDFILELCEDIKKVLTLENDGYAFEAWQYSTIYDGKDIFDKIINLNIKEYHDSKQSKVFYELTDRYFVNKTFLLDYDEEGNILVKIFDKRNGKRIEEEMLSSGEYKILRIIKVLAFSQKSNIYIFDEPELSLSIYWQSMLLDDILKYGRRFKTIIATQSPYMMNGNQIKYLLEVDQNE